MNVGSYKRARVSRTFGVFGSQVLPPAPPPPDSSDHPRGDPADFDTHCQLCIEAYSGGDQQAFVFSLAFLSHHCHGLISSTFRRALLEREIPELLLQVIREITPVDITTTLRMIPLHFECLRLIRILIRAHPDFCDLFLHLDILPVILASVRTMPFSVQAMALAVLTLLVHFSEPASLSGAIAALFDIGVDFFTASDSGVRLAAMELLQELAGRIELLPSTSMLTLLSIFTSVLLAEANREVWAPALDGIAALLETHFALLEKQMPTIEHAILIGLHAVNEMIVMSALHCFPPLYEFASNEQIRGFHQNVDYVLLCGLLRSNAVDAQKTVLNVFGQIVQRGFEDWSEAMVNYSVFFRIMEFALTAGFEIKVGIAKIFGCALARGSEALISHLLGLGGLQLMVDVLDPGMAVDDQLQIEFFRLFVSLFERFPALKPALGEVLLTQENLEFLAAVEPPDEMSAAAHEAFLRLVQPLEGD
jgi:hypothetical protein